MRNPEKIEIVQKGRNWVFKMPYQLWAPKELQGEFNSLARARQVLEDYHKSWRKKVQENQSYDTKHNAKRKEYTRKYRAAKKAEAEQQAKQEAECAQFANANP